METTEDYNIRVDESTASFIESWTYVTDLEREVFYIPNWFEKISDGVYKIHSLDELPESLKNIILSEREEPTEEKQ